MLGRWGRGFWGVVAWCCGGLFSVATAGTMGTIGAGPGQPNPYVSVMVSTRQWVVARLLAPVLQEGRYAVLQTRLAQPWGVGRWRLSTESTLVADCTAQRVALLHTAQNAQPDGDLPPQWVSTGGALQPGPKPAAPEQGVALAGLVFEPVPVVAAPQGDGPRALQVPHEWQVGMAFACKAAQGTEPWGGWAEQVAAEVRLSGGFADVQEMKCRVQGRANPQGIDLHIRHSPGAGAVLLGEKWLADGALYADHWALSDGELAIRFAKATGALRLVLRAESVAVGVGQCLPVQAATPAPRPAASGW